MTNWNQYLAFPTSSSYLSISSYGSSMYDVTTEGSGYLIMQNPADDAYNPSKWSKLEWFGTDGGFAYCTTVYNADSASAAESTDTSSIYDTANAASGCNGFGHTLASAYHVPLAGTYSTAWGSYVTVTDDLWISVSSWGTSVSPIATYTNSFVLHQNPADDACTRLSDTHAARRAACTRHARAAV